LHIGQDPLKSSERYQKLSIAGGFLQPFLKSGCIRWILHIHQAIASSDQKQTVDPSTAFRSKGSASLYSVRNMRKFL
jgi:hypothetical protein